MPFSAGVFSAYTRKSPSIFCHYTPQTEKLASAQATTATKSEIAGRLNLSTDSACFSLRDLKGAFQDSKNCSFTMSPHALLLLEFARPQPSDSTYKEHSRK